MPAKSTSLSVIYTGLVELRVCGLVALNAAGLITTLSDGEPLVVAAAGESMFGFALPAIIAVAFVVPLAGKFVPA